MRGSHVLLLLLGAIPLDATEPVDVALKPGAPWKSYPTRTVADLPALAASAPDTTSFRAVAQPLAYTRIWNFMSSYGKRRGGTYQQPGHTGYPKDAIFVFDPEFDAFCDEHARQLAATKDDPWLLGHFTDNELPLGRGALASFLSLPPGDAGFQAARAFLRERHGVDATASAITDADKPDHGRDAYATFGKTAA
ncbi:MAG: hypothetical protein Q7S40_27375 [Opitutaceae bacterium]|nr:hypothetical protein [Opitutaceae bacterium]